MLNSKYDFRSDTVTEPTEEMREAMARARVGDDGREGDPTVRELEEYSAALLGKEAALFAISGTMGNLVSVLAQTRHGQEVIVERDAHIYWTEVAGLSAVAGLLVNRVAGADGIMAASDVEAAIRPPKLHFPETGLICIENTHNMAGGTVWSVSQMAAVKAVAGRHGIPIHLDGARLFNAAVALGVPPREIAQHVDSLTFCLSKGLSAPVGSLIVGSKAFVEASRKKRQMLGGTTRQGGVLAAAGLVALKTMVARLADDHARAKRLAEKLHTIPGLEVNLRTVQTNIVRTGVAGLGVPAAKVASLLAERNVLVLAQQADTLRWLTHRHVGDEDMEAAVAAMAKVAAQLRQ
ncbi:MAG TPA: GntG family PLP-dependent aldolase [Candidatus Sulfotelmatobacter sp.]|nr:GntG family PLP-dependent aldolase [Candidatus Sulfotelmatobacter sp.]